MSIEAEENDPELPKVDVYILPKGVWGHIGVLFDWLYRNVFFGSLAALISVFSSFLISNAPNVNMRQVYTGLVILAITITMTNTSFAAELRQFLPRRQHHLSQFAYIFSVLLLVIATISHLGQSTQHVTTHGYIAITSIVLAMGLGYAAHLVTLYSRQQLITHLVRQGVRREGYPQDVAARQELLKKEAAKQSRVDDMKI